MGRGHLGDAARVGEVAAAEVDNLQRLVDALRRLRLVVAPMVTLSCRPSRAICVAHRNGTQHSLTAELGVNHSSIAARGAVPRLKLSLWRLDIDLRCLRRVHAGLGEDARFRSH